MFALVILVLSTLPSFAETPSTRVIPPVRRKAILKEAEFYASPTVSNRNFADVRIPFVYVDTTAQEATVSLDDISDADILRYIAKIRKPNGRVKRGDQHYLIFSFGVLKAGDTMTAPYGGSAHKVKIEEINEEFYKLRFNEETLTILFSKIDKSRLRKDK